MSGHSKWSKIKRQKGFADQKKGQLFTKLAREVTLAANSGDNPDKNFRLRIAIDKAKAANMPKSNIENAIARGVGKKKGENFEEVLYEGFGPEGTAVIIETLTNNRNRTASGLKQFFSRSGGSLGEKGTVSYLFELKGFLIIKKSGKMTAEEIILKAIDGGAKEVKELKDSVEIEVSFSDLERIRGFLKKEGLEIVSASQEMVPKTVVQIDTKEKAQKVLQFVEALEELDDVQQVYSNFDIKDRLLDKKALQGE